MGGTALNSKKIDASVGSIVWIRRRNGSWWPGRIMGLNELSEKHLASSRSGTPVKLLGREDASLDWYNLEKSKRVKAFRCGKFRKCIEKAKVSATQANKKVVKFARREDAILHALELESANESNKEDHDRHLREDGFVGTQHETCIRQLHNMDGSGKELKYMDGGGHKLEVNSKQELSQPGTLFEDPNPTNIPKLHSSFKTRRKPPNDSEEDGTESAKRMRGLEDLVMGIESKTQTRLHFHTDGSRQLVQLENASIGMSYIHNSLCDGSPVNSSKGSCPSLKRRPFQVTSCKNLKRKNRHRQLAKVLGSTTLVSVPVRGTSSDRLSLQGGTERNVATLDSESRRTMGSLVMNNNTNCTGDSCENETTLDASVYRNDAGVNSMYFYPKPNENGFSSLAEIPENDCSDSLFEVPLVGEEPLSGGSPIHLLCASRKLKSGAIGREPSHSSPAGSISLSSEGLDKSGSVSADVQLDKISQSIEKSTSRWQWKGYKSSRSLCRKTSKNLDSGKLVDRGCGSDDFLWGTNHMNGLSEGFSSEADINTVDESLVSDNGAHWSNQIRDHNYSDTIKYGRRSLRNNEVVIRSAERSSSQFYLCENSMVAKSTSQMRDNELYLTRSFPFSPLMSQRSHPYCQSRFTTDSIYDDEIAELSSRNIPEVSSLFDVNLEVRTSYRGQQLPLVSLISNLSGKAIIGHSLQVEACDDSYCDLLISRIDGCPTNCSGEPYKILTKRLEAPNYSSVKRTNVKSYLSPKRSTKNRKRVFMSKKTRKLSSFSVVQKEDSKPVIEKLEGPVVVVCVPLKVVFSRINEALNCSTRPTHAPVTI